MRWARLSIRGLMFLVVVASLVTWMGLKARDVYWDNGYHLHIYVDTPGGKPTMSMAYSTRSPFWPRYWRHLLERPWKLQPVCTIGGGHIEEACSVDYPEIKPKYAGDSTHPTPELAAVYARLQKEWDDRRSGP